MTWRWDDAYDVAESHGQHVEGSLDFYPDWRGPEAAAGTALVEIFAGARRTRHIVNAGSSPADAPARLVCNDHGCEIPLHNRRGHVVGYALISCADHPVVAIHRWSRTSHGYAQTSIGDQRIYLHRYVMGLKSGDRREVDHVNHDGLDNRRQNLRVVTHAENAANRAEHARNTSGFRGVWRKRGRWVAQTAVGGRTQYLGTFDTPEEAAAARAAHDSGVAA